MTTFGSLSLAVPRQPRLDAPSTLHHVADLNHQPTQDPDPESAA